MLSAVFLAPVYGVIVTSFKSLKEILELVENLSTDGDKIQNLTDVSGILFRNVYKFIKIVFPSEDLQDDWIDKNIDTAVFMDILETLVKISRIEKYWMGFQKLNLIKQK